MLNILYINMRKVTAYWLLVCIVSVSACTPTQQNAPSTALAQAAVVSFASPGFSIASGSVFAWHSNIILFNSKEAPLSPEIVDFLRHQIEEQLIADGFQMSRSPQRSHYLLSGAIVLGEAMSERELVNAFNLQPSMLTKSDYETGTLVLRVLNPGSLGTEWHGAVEIYRDPSQPEHVRLERGKMGVRRLLRQLPRN